MADTFDDQESLISFDEDEYSAGKTGTIKPSSIRRRKQDALLSFHDRDSFQSKLNFEQQHVQIGISNPCRQ
jgi:hypothetical protein